MNLKKLYGLVAHGDYIKKIIIADRANDTLQYYDFEKFMQDCYSKMDSQEYQDLWVCVSNMFRDLKSGEHYITIALPKDLDFDKFDEQTPIKSSWMLDETKNSLYRVNLNDIKPPKSIKNLFSDIKDFSLIVCNYWDVKTAYSAAGIFKNSKIKNFSFMNWRLQTLSNLYQSLMNTNIYDFRLRGADMPMLVSFEETCATCQRLEHVYMQSNKFSRTHKVSMRGMFRDCPNLLDVSFKDSDMYGVRDVSFLFKNCKSLETVDFSGCRFSNLDLASGLFYNCTNLFSVELHPAFLECNSVKGMFYNCPAGEAYRDKLPSEAFEPLGDDV